jgi:S1-C subfamily serine protease
MKMLAVLVACVLALLGAGPAGAEERGQGESAAERVPDAAAAERRVENLVSAVVRVRMKALPDARSSEMLGAAREGTGVVIDDAGHVLTIGYLVIEPESIEVTTADDKNVPAELVGYDHATGFGLLKAQVPLGVNPIALGESGALAVREPVMILPWGSPAAASVALVVSRREFTGSWEYLLDSAIFVSPPTLIWQGAALVNRDYKLVGVGSLLVSDSMRSEQPIPGNMFVPIDLLKPILADLKARGRAADAPHPWLGVMTEEARGGLVVSRVPADSPADRAGVKPGDIVLGVGETPVKTHAELYRMVWGLGPAGVEVPLKVLQDGDTKDIRVKSIDRADFFRKKPLH